MKEKNIGMELLSNLSNLQYKLASILGYSYIATYSYVLCMCVLILVDMTNVRALCGDSDINDSSYQWPTKGYVQLCMYRTIIRICINVGKYSVIIVTVGSMLIALKLQDNRLSTRTSLSFV